MKTIVSARYLNAGETHVEYTWSTGEIMTGSPPPVADWYGYYAQQFLDGGGTITPYYTPDNWRREHTIAAYEQVPYYSPVELAEDPSLHWELEFANKQVFAVLLALAGTADVDLPTFDPSFAAHPVSDPEYADNLAKQELEALTKDSELRAAGDPGALTDTERTDSQARLVHNRQVAQGLATGPTVPTVGAMRSAVVLEGESSDLALFEEVQFEWAAQQYYIPQVLFQHMPPDVNTAQLFAMVYDESDVYRSWMPFVYDAVKDQWRTPSNLDYISIGKTSSAVWRVAIAYNGTSADYEITSRVSLVPPDVARSKIRWGGRN